MKNFFQKAQLLTAHLPSDEVERRIRFVFIVNRLLNLPFWGMLYLLSFILYQDLHISSFQVTLIAVIKPLSALFAPYLSQLLYRKPDNLIFHLSCSQIMRYLPFLCMPWITSSWVIIAAFGFYMILYRGVIPAWLETIKQNLAPAKRERLIAYGSAIDYLGAALLPLLIGLILDHFNQAWKWLFPLTAMIGVVSTFLLFRIPFSQEVTSPLFSWKTVKEKIFTPWKQSLHLLKTKPDFLTYQAGFMLGGAGLMIIQPALPMFFVDVLHLSYTKMLSAIALCKGIGFALATPLWVKFFARRDIFLFSGSVTIFAALFPLFLLGTQWSSILLYIGYALYGMMQAGSELSWNMSGPVFSKAENSTPYSSTNVLMVGLRGCFFPPLGAFIHGMMGASSVLILSALLCAMATIYLFSQRSKYASIPSSLPSR